MKRGSKKKSKGKAKVGYHQVIWLGIFVAFKIFCWLIFILFLVAQLNCVFPRLTHASLRLRDLGILVAGESAYHGARGQILACTVTTTSTLPWQVVCVLLALYEDSLSYKG